MTVKIVDCYELLDIEMSATDSEVNIFLTFEFFK